MRKGSARSLARSNSELVRVQPYKMVGFGYLSPAHLQGFNTYKYNAKETSPLAVYVILPLWNRIVKLLPMWLAPNLMTLTGWLLLMLNFWLLAYYDWDYNTTSNERGLKRPPIPSSVWIFCGLSHVLAYALDGMDGKQARRTSSSTPLGELFDHGCDSWAAIFIPLGLMSAFGRGSEWGGNIHHGLLPCLSTLAGFYLSHWEKYITGCLDIPWIYDVVHLGSGAGYLVTGLFGVQVWHFHVFPDWNVAMVIKWLLILGFLGSIPTSLWNIYRHYQTQSPSSDEQVSASERKLGFFEAISPWCPFVMFSVLYIMWVEFSPSDILEKEPRILIFSMGVLFSNIACRLIVCQMTGQPADIFNALLVPLVAAIVTSFIIPRYEMSILYIHFAIVLVAHLHYAISIVTELCEHFHIYAFSLTKREPTS